MKIAQPHPPMHYGELDRMLKVFGFIRSDIPQERALLYRHLPTDTLLVLPAGEASEWVSPLNLVSVRKHIAEKGVATLEGYSAVVEQVSRVTAGQAVKA